MCCIKHIQHIGSDSALLDYLERNHRSDNKFYTGVTWNEIQVRSAKLNLTFMKIICDILSFYHPWFSCLGLMFYVLIFIYGILAILNTFTSSLIAALIMYETWNFH